MTYTISQTPCAELSTEQLLEEIASFKTLAVEVVARYAEILTELKFRGHYHGFMRHPVLSFFKQIAEGSLHPEAALTLGNEKLIAAVAQLPHEQQLEIARGALVPVARRTDTGEIRSDDLPIERMDQPTMRRAFGPDGIRSVHEQAEMIRAEGKVQRIGAVTVLRDEQLLKIGNQKIKPEDLKGPLAALGFRLVLARSAADA
mgnify:CR=1 FL=1